MVGNCHGVSLLTQGKRTDIRGEVRPLIPHVTPLDVELAESWNRVLQSCPCRVFFRLSVVD